MTVGVYDSDRPPGQADPGDDYNRQHNLRRAGRREGSRLGSGLPGYGAKAGKGGWEAQTHPHSPLSVPPLRRPRSAHSRQGLGLPDGQGDGRIPDHPGSGFAAQIKRGQTDSSPSTLSTTWAIANAQQEEEVHIQGAFRIATSPIQGTIEPGSTGTTAKGAATGYSIGGRTGVGGQALRQHRERIPAGPRSLRIDGTGTGADRLRARGKPGGDHSNDPDAPKAHEVDGLRIRIASLISENSRLETQVADRNRRAEAAEAQTLVAASQALAAEARAVAAEARAAAAKEARAFAESESTKWHGVFRKFFDSLGFPGDVVTKARIFDQCMKKLEAVSAASILRMLVDFSARVENLLKEIWSAFQLSDRGHEAGPSKQRPDLVPGPSRPEPPSPPTATPGAPPTGAPSASTPRPEATPSRPEAAATPNISDPTQQEPIPDSLNTDDIPSLHQWGTEDLPESGTPATESRGPTDPVIRITPGSVPRSQPRRPGSV